MYLYTIFVFGELFICQLEKHVFLRVGLFDDKGGRKF